MRRFIFRRYEDETGVSGTGVVVQGVEFPNGQVALQWQTETGSIVLWNNIHDAIKVHGHDGKTKLEWVD